jgi:hypothetical protein
VAALTGMPGMEIFVSFSFSGNVSVGESYEGCYRHRSYEVDIDVLKMYCHLQFLV